MIKAVHTLVYSDDPEATRAFLRDVVGWRHIEDADSDPGWLIFKTGPSELGVHPTASGRDGVPASPQHHSISLMCDDLAATMSNPACAPSRTNMTFMVPDSSMYLCSLPSVQSN